MTEDACIKFEEIPIDKHFMEYMDYLIKLQISAYMLPRPKQEGDMTLPKLHYFDQEEADEGDILLLMAKGQGYVPKTCLLGGATVMHEVRRNRSPCTGCAGPREKCQGKLRA